MKEHIFDEICCNEQPHDLFKSYNAVSHILLTSEGYTGPEAEAILASAYQHGEHILINGARVLCTVGIGYHFRPSWADNSIS